MESAQSRTKTQKNTVYSSTTPQRIYNGFPFLENFQRAAQMDLHRAIESFAVCIFEL